MIGETGRRAEAKSARRMGSRVSKGSGCGLSNKGDYEIDGFKVEHKATEKMSLSLKYEWLAKIAKEAAAVGENPALQLVFCTGSGDPRPNGSWVAIPEWLFRELMERKDTE